MTVRIVFVLLLLRSSVVHSAEAPALPPVGLPEHCIWFCPECCPNGEFIPQPDSCAGVFHVALENIGDVYRHLRELHSDQKGYKFREGVLRAFIWDNENIPGCKKPKAKKYLADIAVDGVLSEVDYAAAGMMRVDPDAFLAQAGPRRKRPADPSRDKFD